MRDDKARINVAPLDSFQQLAPVTLHMALPGPYSQTSIHHRPHRKLIYEPAIDTYDRDRASIATGHDGFAQGYGPVRLCAKSLLRSIINVADAVPAKRLHANVVNAGVRPAPASHLHQGFVGVLLFVVDRLSAASLSHSQPLRHVVNRNDALRP